MLFLFYSILATTGMTLFSYVCGFITGHQFREPELLNQLIANSSLPINPSKNNPIGWLLHFSIGYFFGIILFEAWSIINWENFYLFIGVAGIAAGIIGILGWHVMIKSHSNPPEIHIKNFYMQLLVAHIIFVSLFSIYLL